MDILLDPTRFNIEQMKQMNMWPPGDIAGLGVLPYIKRLKANNLRVLDVGVGKGENASYLLEHTQTTVKGETKIEKLHGLRFGEEDNDVLEQNMKAPWFDRFELGYPKDMQFDVICINSQGGDLDKNLKEFYNMLKSGGIYCGNDHALPHVKEALHKFRRTVKIGELIHVARGNWFWYRR